MAEETDEMLMRRVKQGERPAFDVIFSKWRQPIWAFLMRRLGSASLAEDAFQDCWTRVWRFREKYDPNKTFRSWLYTIAANAGHDQWSRPIPTDFAPQTSTDGRQLTEARALLDAIFTLEGKDRTVILLTAEGFEPIEIAEIMGQDANAIRARLSRARQKIRESFL